MRFLFVKTELSWPRTSGHDVHCYHMMQALANTGHEVFLLTATATQDKAVAGLNLVDRRVLPEASHSLQNTGDRTAALSTGNEKPTWSWRQERFRSYWGISEASINFTRDYADEIEADAVVVVGLEVLPYLLALRNQQRIWYAADEWVWHHLSLLRVTQPKTWSNVSQSVILGMYEHAFASVMDRIWVVSAADRRAMRLATWSPAVDLVPNGVSTTTFSPTHTPVEPFTCTFWGNLGFTPNEQALNWFCLKVWPLLKKENPAALFNIFGFNPSDEVKALASIEGISLTPNVPDIRNAVSSQAVVVLPFQSGGGIKNKLLEAASMEKAIVCSHRAFNGLNSADKAPFKLVPTNPQLWADTIQNLWNDPALCLNLGREARQWVEVNHSWDTAAKTAAGAAQGIIR